MLGVVVQVTSWYIEAKKGADYLLDTYQNLVLSRDVASQLSAKEKLERISVSLGDWYTQGHPLIGKGFPQKIPFTLIKRPLKQIVKGKKPESVKITIEESSAHAIKLGFALDRYAWAGETPCATLAKILLMQYDNQVIRNHKEIKLSDSEAEDWSDNNTEQSEQEANDTADDAALAQALQQDEYLRLSPAVLLDDYDDSQMEG